MYIYTLSTGTVQTTAYISTSLVLSAGEMSYTPKRTVALKVPPSCSKKYISSPLFSLPAVSGIEVGSMLKIQPSLGGPSEYRSYLGRRERCVFDILQ